ncbi:hypothetical protein SAMN05428969_2966 [Devosia sp. YR412]|uniref:hypothetical protein n=1 Tax=Devosia sp. YR412 TaxID=1881030 RepID=UPI0008C8CE41|nr:hypothetical protein [Devosia sp. YR412]SEQ40949.1 hypothetical protein SAMN05428969_2966 [Devosia sp. YR412]
MTDIREQFRNINISNIKYLHSELIPECTNSSDYNIFINGYISNLKQSFAEANLEMIDQLLVQLAATPVSGRRKCIKAFEQAQPALFKRLYGDLLTYFYSTKETAERVRQLADSGPREASPHFDPSLLDAVIANQSGKRRL